MPSFLFTLDEPEQKRFELLVINYSYDKQANIY